VQMCYRVREVGKTVQVILTPAEAVTIYTFVGRFYESNFTLNDNADERENSGVAMILLTVNASSNIVVE
jgi:hypothetical protein